jgi:hypothetical protein
MELRGPGRHVSDQQRLYARWLDWTARMGLSVLAVAFLLYAFGVVEAHVPVERLPELWSLPLDRYLALTGAPSGWGWLRVLHKGEYLSLLGVALLGLATIVCYVRVGVRLVRSGERLQALLVALQILVLAAAAANLFSAGH